MSVSASNPEQRNVPKSTPVKKALKRMEKRTMGEMEEQNTTTVDASKSNVVSFIHLGPKLGALAELVPLPEDSPFRIEKITINEKTEYRMVMKSPSLPTVSNDAASFELFPKLPTEIRLKIWKLALPGPRIVKVRPCSVKFMEELAAGDMTKHTFVSPTKAPSILFVCGESRKEAMKTYQLNFGSEHHNIPSTVYFNFDLDMLYFPCDYGKELHLKEFVWGRAKPLDDEQETKIVRLGANKVERIGMCSRAIAHIGLQKHVGYLKTKQFNALQEVVVTVDQSSVQGSTKKQYELKEESILEELSALDLEVGRTVLRKCVQEYIGESLIQQTKDWKDWVKHGRSGRTNDDFVPELKVMKVSNPAY